MSLTDISTALTDEILQDIVTKKFGPSAKYVSWRFTGGFKKGDSYLSEVFKVEIDIKTTGDELAKLYTVIKSVPKNVGRRKTFRSADFFRNEINFYQHILKSFFEFQEEVQPEITYTEIATFLAGFYDGVNDFIVLEDLSPDGYGTVNRQTGMDFNHMKLALEILGKFHGLALVYRHQRPNEFEKLLEHIEETYYSARLKPWYKDFQLNQEKIARHAVSHEYPGSIYLEKLENFFSGDLYDKMVHLTHERNKYSVFVHGDCWTPNFLFKYGKDSNVPVGLKLIDFQLTRFASPALDISFFIYSCTDQDLREKHYEDLLKAYHASLSGLVKSFGSDPNEVFPYSALIDEMKRSARFGVGMGIESIPFSVIEDPCDLDQIKGDEAVPITTVWILRPLETKEGRQRLADMVKHAVDCGFLD